jgi:hypothetical protein
MWRTVDAKSGGGRQEIWRDWPYDPADHVEDKQKQWEEKWNAKIAKHERLLGEVMRLSEPWLMQIKNKKKPAHEMNALGIVGVDVMGKIESVKI